MKNVNFFSKLQWILIIFIFFQIAGESSTSQIEKKPRVDLMQIGSKEQQLDNLFIVIEKRTIELNKLYK